MLKMIRVVIMEPDRPEIGELMRAWGGVILYLIDVECEEFVCLVYVIPQKPVRLYDELDELAASIAFSKLPSID